MDLILSLTVELLLLFQAFVAYWWKMMLGFALGFLFSCLLRGDFSLVENSKEDARET